MKAPVLVFSRPKRRRAQRLSEGARKFELLKQVRPAAAIVIERLITGILAEPRSGIPDA